MWKKQQRTPTETNATLVKEPATKKRSLTGVLTATYPLFERHFKNCPQFVSVFDTPDTEDDIIGRNKQKLRAGRVGITAFVTKISCNYQDSRVLEMSSFTPNLQIMTVVKNN